MGKFGRRGLPSTRVRLQRRAISTVLASAEGTSAKRRAISSELSRYWSCV
ncbi:Uncharacterised protein [Bordetella pertussis]|nr:Uncharacterised protein [Bordetella pertussis]